MEREDFAGRRGVGREQDHGRGREGERRARCKWKRETKSRRRRRRQSQVTHFKSKEEKRRERDRRTNRAAPSPNLRARGSSPPPENSIEDFITQPRSAPSSTVAVGLGRPRSSCEEEVVRRTVTEIRLTDGRTDRSEGENSPPHPPPLPPHFRHLS